MTSLLLGMNQVDSLTTQQNQLQYVQMVAMNNYQFTTSRLSSLSSNPNINMESKEVKGLQEQQKLFDSQQKSIEAQLKLITQQVDSYKKLVEQAAKESKFA